MRALYTLFLRLVLPFFLLRLWWRGRREPGYRDSVEERFGAYETEVKPKMVWIHAVSVGEARAAAPLVRALQELLPDHGLLLTCTTAAGRETLKQVYGESVVVAYLPYDYPHAIQGFLEHFRPRLGVLMETEVWPNLVAVCAENAVPLLLANARMSEKSARGYRRLRGLAEPAFRSLAAVCAQSAGDAERLASLGARQIEVTGNLKFDVEPVFHQLEAGRAWRAALARPVLLLASTREGEEKLLLDALPREEETRTGRDGKLLV
ncbi:MAG TPA: glycosyltransferase N-terminal domain-containing protein, partial [Burkholderiales bacterium]